MKKTYTTPIITIDSPFTDFIMATSGGVKGYVDNEEEIGSGGTDEDGGLMPASNDSFWDDDC